MQKSLNEKVVSVSNNEAIVDNASFTTTEIDTFGFNRCKIYVYVGTTDIAMAALKVQESDTSGSGFADVDGLDMNGDTAIDGVAAALPAATDDDKFIIFDINLVGRKRYLDLVATAGDGTAGTWLQAFAVLSDPVQGLATETEMGAETVLSV